MQMWRFLAIHPLGHIESNVPSTIESTDRTSIRIKVRVVSIQWHVTCKCSGYSNDRSGVRTLQGWSADYLVFELDVVRNMLQNTRESLATPD